MSIYRIKQNKAAICFTFIIFLSFNIVVYFYLVNFQTVKNIIFLQAYQENINLIIVPEIKKILSGETDTNSFLFNNYTEVKIINNKGKHQLSSNVQVTPYAIEIYTVNEKKIFLLQGLKEYLDRFLPAYVDYNISINKNRLAFRQTRKQNFDLESTYKINNIDLVVELSIDKDSKFYLSNEKLLVREQSIWILISFIVSIISLYLHLRIKEKIVATIISLKNDLFKERKATNEFLRYHKTKQQLKFLFIKKVTELYIKHELNKFEDIDDQIKQEIKDYLFPISITDTTTSKINTKEFSDLLLNYFTYYSNITILKLSIDTEHLKLPCGKEVFYQVIFSLIYNIIIFAEEQSNKQKSIILSITSTKLIITYQSFPLDEQQMIQLSNQLFLEKPDIFLLSCAKIFKSLKEHNLSYCISVENEFNSIEIIISKLSEQEAMPTNITKFRNINKSPK